MSTARLPTHAVPTGTSDVHSARTSLSQSGAPRPTLGQLPRQVKSLIVAMVAESVANGDPLDVESDFSDFEDEDVGHPGSGQRRTLAGVQPVKERKFKSTMSALSLVDREFLGLVQSCIWKNIDLTDASVPDIGMFLLDFAPRHGRHVEGLALQLQDAVGWNPRWEKLSPALTARWESLQYFPEEQEESRILRFRRVLFAELVLLLPNLVRVEVDYFDTDERDSIPAYLQQNEATDAIAKIGPQVTHLSIQNKRPAWGEADEVRTSEGHLASFLLAFDHLVALTLIIPLLPAGRSDLQTTLSSFTSLRSLQLHGASFANDDFAILPWTTPLENLILVKCAHISFTSLLKLLTQVSSSLETLHLNAVPDYITPSEADTLLHPIHLPKLYDLVVRTDLSDQILQVFTKAPLTDLVIDACPRIAYGSWVSFIAKHSTLQCVELLEGHPYTLEGVAHLRLACEGRKVTLLAGEPDYGPDHGFIEGDDYSDEDDY